MNNFSKIKYWVFDVDGTMTDGSIYYDENGNELKKFNTRDAAGFFAIHALSMKIIVMTGRECKATLRRMEELKVDYLFQNIKDKKVFLEELMSREQILSEELAYIGDDLNDYAAMKLTGFVACPADACKEIVDIADYVADRAGGRGAVREVVEYVLSERNEWEEAIKKAYDI